MSKAKNGEAAQLNFSDSETTGDDDTEDDAVGLVLMDEDSSSSRSRKYVVSGEGKYGKHVPTWCQPKKWTRSERICVVVGCIALVVILGVFATVGVVAARSKVSSSVSQGGSNNGTDHGGGSTNGTDHGGNNGTDHGGGSNNGTDHGGGSNNTNGTGGGGEVPWASVRLQSSIIPERYDIDLAVDMGSFQVSGIVNIICSVESSASYIALHAKDMNVSGHAVRNTDGDLVEYDKVLYPKNDFFVFNLTAPLEPGQIVLTLHFDYALRKDLAGFYRSSYMNSNGEQRYLATTQFEPTDARRAFPCFDEPSFKARFSMHITHHSQYRAWFNMPVVNRSQAAPDSAGLDMVTTSFQTSVKMSTYLVAFIVSDFECVNDTIVSISGEDVVVSKPHPFVRIVYQGVCTRYFCLEKHP